VTGTIQARPEEKGNAGIDTIVETEIDQWIIDMIDADSEAGKIVIEYVKRTKELTRILGKLTESYCGTTGCPKTNPNLGCCDQNHYEIVGPKEIQSLQEAEARQNMTSTGLSEETPNSRTDNEECLYHTEQGCSLELFRPPLCLGYLCGKLVSDIQGICLEEEALQFTQYMARIKDCSLGEDPEKLFIWMDAAIEAGRTLIGYRNKLLEEL